MTTEHSDNGEHRILVVDDEKALAQMVSAYLTKAGYQVTTAHTGPEGLKAARESDPAVVVLDLGLPGMDGIEVCRQIRTFSDAYVLILTARDDEVDKIVGLSVGADDYITKPFSPRELVARVQAVLRRPRTTTLHQKEDAQRVFGALRIDIAGHEAYLGDRLLPLTPTEFDILNVLSSRPRLAFSRAQIIAGVWGNDWYGDEHVVDVHIGHVRKKLDDDAESGRYIATVRGVGYRMGRG